MIRNGRNAPPRGSPNYREDVRKSIESANDHHDFGRKSVEFPWPDTASGPVSEFRDRGFFRMPAPMALPRRDWLLL